MLKKLSQMFKQYQGIMITASSIAVLSMAGNWLGLFQILEWASYDNLMKLRPQESQDQQIVIVTLDEQEITKFGHPLSDEILADLLRKIKQQHPIVIGLDLYRNVKVEKGYNELAKIFQTTPNLIGVEKATNDQVPPPPILAEKKQVGLADLIVDPDGKIRRTFISVQLQENDPEIKLSLSIMMALKYLESQKIEAISNPQKPYEYALGKIRLKPLNKSDGGYVNADTRGYQMLINYRGTRKKFISVSISDVINNNISTEFFKNKMVFIGAIAPSLNDNYQTPLEAQMPGVVIHANITSQIVNGALEGRPLLKNWSDGIEGVWIVTWSFIGAVISWRILANYSFKHTLFASVLWLIVAILILSFLNILIAYSALLMAWWIPVATPLFALVGSALVIASYKAQSLHRLASLDALTQVVNRRYFDEQIYKLWYKKVGGNDYLSVILCDVDFFKFYNDTYGHQAGDKCLQQVAHAMTKSVRSHDIVARYGGEEFVIILPNTNGETATKVAQNICDHVQNLQIPHQASKINNYVSLSCGVSSMIPDEFSSPASLIAEADKALYEAKKRGRNQVVLR